MKLSISNIGFDDNQKEKVYELLNKYKYSGLEIAPSIFVGENPYDKNDIAAQKAKKLYDDYKLKISSMQSIWYGCTGNIFVEDEALNLIEYTKKAVLFAKEIECGNLVFGCPKNRFIPEGKNEKDAEGFFNAIAKFACENNTNIALEANPEIYGTNFCNKSEQAFNFAKNIEGLKMNYDLGTLLINGESLEVLQENIKLVNHVHVSEKELMPISDAKERRILHRELAKLLKNANYNNYVSIEMKKCDLNQVEKIIYQVAEDFS